METRLLDLFFPRRCVGCGVVGGWVCVKCGEGLEEASSLQVREVEGGLAVVSLFNFAQPLVRELLHNLKYNGIFEVGEVARGLAEKVCPREELLGALRERVGVERLVLVPVPSTKAKRKLRGYNQAEVLGETLGAWLDVPVEKGFLLRQGKRTSQVGKSKEERQQGLMGEFRVIERGEQCRGYGIVVLDDLVTTGSTLQVCCKVLRAAGYENVVGLTVGYEE